MAKQPRVTHFQDAANVTRLISVKKKMGLGRVGIFVVVTFQEAQRDKRIQKITDAALMQAEPLAKCFSIERSRREFGKQAEFGGAQEGFRGPEAETDL
jgi:hypothetical protein